MKKTAILLAFVMLLLSLSGLTTVFAASSLNPYSGFAATQFDETTNKNCTTASGMLGAVGRNAVYTYKDINFGKVSPISVTLEIGGAVGDSDKTVSMYIDSPGGTPIATFNAATNGWSVPVAHTCEITVNIIGVHTLYIKSASNGDHNYFNISFKQPVTGANVYKEYDPTASTFKDVAESPYIREINMMNELGLLLTEEGATEYYPNLPVTRGRFAQVIENLMTTETGSGGAAGFSDVTEDMACYDAVGFCVDRGYISGYEDGTFRPNKFIEVNEAVTVLCRVLGYDVYAQKRGGYLAGYLQLATANGLFEGIPSGGAVSEEVLARLLYNAVKADYYDIVSLQADRLSYAKRTDGILSQTHGIYKAEGLVSANNFSSLASPETKFTENRVHIGGSDYDSGTGMARSLLGYHCEFFYTEKAGDAKIMTIAPLRTEVTEVSSADSDISSITDREIIYYDADGDKETIRVEDSSYILYNGVAIDQKLSELVTIPFRGYIRYIENATDTDTLCIYEYTNAEIGGISIGEELLYENVSKSTVSVGSDNVFVFFTKDGNACALSDLTVGDNAVLYQSKNKTGKTLYRYIISSETVTGTVGMIDGDKLYIDDVAYKKAKELTKSIPVGTTASFKVNSFGEIVAIADKAESNLLGYLIEQGREKQGAFGDVAIIKLLSEANVIEELTLNATCTVDGKQWKDNKAVLTDSMCNAPVRYSKNAAGLVTKLDTVVSNMGGDDDRLRPVISAETAYYWCEASRAFAKTSNGLQDFILTDNAKILCKDPKALDEEDYRWATTSALISDPMTGMAYSFDEREGFADIFVWKKDNKDYSDTMVFDKLATTVNAEGDSVLQICGYNGRETVSYVVSDKAAQAEAIARKLQKGDWVRFYLDGINEVAEVQLISLISGADSLTLSDGTVVSAKLTADNSMTGSAVYTRLTGGTVQDRDGKYVTLKHDTGEVEYIYLGSAVGVKYEKGSSGAPRLINGISADGLKTGDRVYFAISKKNTSMVYVISQS